jgi:protein-tyrosine phosphatase
VTDGPAPAGPSRVPAEPDRLRLLVVCTANVCRSVMAGASMRARFPDTLAVRTAGLLATGAPADPLAVSALAERGLTEVPRPSQRLERDHVHAADLVLGLAMHHVRDVVVLDRSAFPRSFALAELAHLAEERGPWLADEPFAAWLRRMHEGREVSALTAPRSPFDIDDPTGGSPEGYRRAAERIDRLVGSLERAWAAHLQPPAPAIPGGTVAVAAITDAPDSPAARQLVELVAVETTDGWHASARSATARVSAGDDLVLVVSDEPHGVAMEANRSSTARAAVVVNAGTAARHLRRLEANIWCIPSAAEPAVLTAIIEVAKERPEPHGTGARRWTGIEPAGQVLPSQPL